MTSRVETWCNILHDFPAYARRDPAPRRLEIAAGGRTTDVRPQLTLELFRQANSADRAEVPIPDDVLELYSMYRPTPLIRAKAFEQALGTKSRIYVKFEGQNAAGSHKLNSAIAQAYYFKKAGVERIVTGTGAGQWGAAISWACGRAGLGATVFMVGVSYRQKPLRPVMMRVYGGEVHESPSEVTEVGRAGRIKDPQRIGSLSIANGEAIEIARSVAGARFAVGSGENHVLLHQTIIGQEAVNQMEEIGDYPNVVTACVGAGSNFAGISFPFIRNSRKSGRNVRIIAAEPVACPKLTRGLYAYDMSDASSTTPYVRMMTLGRDVSVPGIHAGGLRYHGTSPLLSAMYQDGLFEARSFPQRKVFETAVLFARSTGMIVAPESAHALAAAADAAREATTPISVLANVSGHGLLDLSSYDAYLNSEIDDGLPDEANIARSLTLLRQRNEQLEEAI
ncbi:MAG TPA: TrpB-like pyridoxal phosphate-dependent enzyme [Thermoanaerobaculia bacterium]|nr:TrpB-like pyridoxal phosphate-dependent enzyme [Thermoanaerobaculia bacterium]